MARVLLTGFCAVPGPGRASVQLRHVIRALMQQHSVDVLVVREGDQSYVERQGNVRILRVPVAEGGSSTANDLTVQIQSFQRALKRQLEGADYEIVHCRDSWAGLVALEAKRHLGYSVIYDLTRSPLGEAPLEPQLYAQYTRQEQACMRAADIVLAPTTAAAAALANVATGNVVLAPLGVDVDRFDWDEPPKTGVPRVLYVGSIEASRGIRVLMRAMAAITREVEAQLVLAGPTSSPRFEHALRETVAEFGIADFVERVGPIDHDQVPALIATATVCVVPAALDLLPNPMVAFPSKLLEYMACRRAIAAPKRQTISLVVKDKKEALLFEPGDPADLARCVVRLLTDASLRERLATAAYERVRREFTASAVRRAVRGAYASVTARLAHTPALPHNVVKAELMSDDEFEATVIEQAAEVAAGDTGLHRMSDIEVIDEVVDHSLHPRSGTEPSSPANADAIDSGEHSATVQSPSTGAQPDSGRWSESGRAAVAVAEESAVTTVAAVIWPRDGTDQDGTPAEGMVVVAPSTRDSVFVAGEIDLPPHSHHGSAAHPGDPGKSLTRDKAGVIDLPTPMPKVHAPDFAETPDPDTGVSPRARSRNTRSES